MALLRKHHARQSAGKGVSSLLGERLSRDGNLFREWLQADSSARIMSI
jgi:hypothetical protein